MLNLSEGNLMKIKIILLTIFIFIFTAFANAQTSLIGEWKIISIADAKKGNVPLDKAANTITFEKNRFYGTICNNFSGNYTRSKNKLKTSQMITTLMACSDIKNEHLVTSVFDKQTYFSVDNNVLTLSDQKRQITLRLEKVKKKPVSIFDKWQLNSLRLDGKEFSWDSKQEVFLNIEKDKIGGNGGCNSYGGNIAIKGNTVKFSNIFSTKMFCEGSVENQYFAALEKVTSIELQKGQLMLMDKRKQTVLIFYEVTE